MRKCKIEDLKVGDTFYWTDDFGKISEQKIVKADTYVIPLPGHPKRFKCEFTNKLDNELYHGDWPVGESTEVYVND